MAEEKVSLGGFDLISDLLTPGGSKGENGDVGKEYNYVDPEDIETFMEESETEESEVEEETEEETESTEEPDEIGEEEEEEESIDDKGKDPKNISDEDKELEKDMATFLKTKFEEDHGITFGEGEISSIDDIVKQLSEIVEEGSKPQYANDEVAAYDEFVRQGGQLRDFYKQAFEGSIDVENIDLTSETNQKAVLKEHLKTKGYKDANIEARIERYDNAGVLEEEALEAAELLKEYNKEKQVRLLEDQKVLHETTVKQQREFVANVETTIDEMSDIRGIPLNKQEKAALKDYLFKPEKNGRTAYQNEYMNNTRNLVESAFFTKNGKSLIKKAQDKAASDAYKKVQQTFKSNKGKRQQGSSDQSTGGAMRSLGQVSSLLLRK